MEDKGESCVDSTEPSFPVSVFDFDIPSRSQCVSLLKVTTSFSCLKPSWGLPWLPGDIWASWSIGPGPLNLSLAPLPPHLLPTFASFLPTEIALGILDTPP